MNRYEVRDNATGSLIASYIGEVPIESNPEAWGDPGSYSVVAVDITYEYELSEARSKRAAKYPLPGDQLDAAYKARAGDDTDQKAIDAQIRQVKLDNPKPKQGA